ncbi:methyltransferase [bacterium]|nr:methyltransferase [bacterium]
MTLSDLHEYRPDHQCNALPGNDLPPVPGGWVERTIEIAGHALSLALPASPDALLDDPEVLKAHERDEYMPYWAYLWPASIHMAGAVLRQAWAPGTAALELGAGVGLVGLAGLQAGLAVTFSDYDATSVDLCLHNARRLGFSTAQGKILDWRRLPAETYPVLLGCELLYEDRNHDLLIDVFHNLLAPGGTAWFGDGGRARAERFCRLLIEAGYRYDLIDEQGQPLSQLRVGRYQLIQVQRA